MLSKDNSVELTQTTSRITTVGCQSERPNTRQHQRGPTEVGKRVVACHRYVDILLPICDKSLRTLIHERCMNVASAVCGSRHHGTLPLTAWQRLTSNCQCNQTHPDIHTPCQCRKHFQLSLWYQPKENHNHHKPSQLSTRITSAVTQAQAEPPSISMITPIHQLQIPTCYWDSRLHCLRLSARWLPVS